MYDHVFKKFSQRRLGNRTSYVLAVNGTIDDNLYFKSFC